MIYRSCYGCIHGTGACQARDAMKAKIKGIGITSMKWKCSYRRPAFAAGEGISINLFMGMTDQGDSWGREEPEYGWFPGYAIEVKGTKILAFILPGTRSDCDEYEFQPKSNGYVKTALTRVQRRDAVREHVCEGCHRLVRLIGHEDYCRNQPADQRPKEECRF
jgi:hypothetical protein